jgi:hypothetical protein
MSIGALTAAPVRGSDSREASVIETYAAQRLRLRRHAMWTFAVRTTLDDDRPLAQWITIHANVLLWTREVHFEQ